MRISITSPESDFFQSIDVASDLSIQDLKSLVEAMLGDSSFQLVFQSRLLTNMQATLTQVGVHEDDVIVIAKPSTSHPSSSSSSSSSFSENEYFRQQLLTNPQLQQQLAHIPGLLQAAQQGSQPFVQALSQMNALTQQAQSSFDSYQADPYNVEMQKKIEEAIRLERVANNFELALEHHPESFGRVHMLYVYCEVNGVGVNALVDSGAQMTLLSPSFAEKCNLMSLMDHRFQGTAKGVGTAKLLGRIHVAPLKLGDVHLMCSFTVMEGKDVDVLLGLDMLRRYQVVLDFNLNVFRIQNQNVPFVHHTAPPSPTAPPAPPPSQPSAPSVPTSSSSTHPHIQTLIDMGASKDEAKAALEKVNGNLDLAAALLFSP